MTGVATEWAVAAIVLVSFFAGYAMGCGFNRLTRDRARHRQALRRQLDLRRRHGPYL